MFLFSSFIAVGILFGRFNLTDPFVLFCAGCLSVAVLYQASVSLRILSIIAMTIGVALISVHDHRVNTPSSLNRLMSDEKVDVIAEVEAVDSVRFINTRYLLKIKSVNKTNVDGYLRWYKRNKAYPPRLLPGDILEITEAKLKKPHSYRNIGAWNYERHMRDRSIDGALRTVKKSKVTILSRGDGVMAALEKIKNRLRKNLTFENSGITAISRAMLIGDQGLLTPKAREMFSRAGNAHLLAVSGLHVGFIAMAGFFIAKAFAFSLIYPLRYKWASAAVPTQIAALCALFLVIFYAALTGPRISSARAAIMVGVYLLAIFSGRPKDFYGAFSVALAVILFAMPWSIFEAGFQLSFVAVLAIVIFMERFYKPLFEDAQENVSGESAPARLLRRFPKVASFAAISLFASIGTAPLVVYHFNVIPSYGVLLNTLQVPPASLIAPFGIVSSFGMSQWALDLTEMMMNFIWRTSEWTLTLPGAYSHTGSIPVAAVVIYYILIGSIAFLNRGLLRRYAIAMTIPALIASLAYNPIISSMDKNLTIRFVDVGQADSIVITWPKGGAMVIDGGNRYTTFDLGRSIVAPVLWRAQRTKLSAMIATHSDNDHIGGLPGLADRVPPQLLLDHGELAKKSRAYQAIRSAGYQTLTKGDKIAFADGPTIEVLNPPDINALPYRDTRNNRSLVLKLTYKKVRVLLTADISKKTERWLIDTGADLKADVLKIAHHGSNTSSTSAFLNAVGAHTAVISAGYKNRFRHPTKKVLARLKEHGIKIYRTDLDGEVVMKTDGESIEWVTYQDTIGAK